MENSRPLNDSTGGWKGAETLGWLFHTAGWLFFFASILFGLSSKSGDPPYLIHFGCSLSVLVLGASAYIILRMVSERWRSKAMRVYFSPYLVGATCWVLLIVLLLLLDRFAG